MSATALVHGWQGRNCVRKPRAKELLAKMAANKQLAEANRRRLLGKRQAPMALPTFAGNTFIGNTSGTPSYYISTWTSGTTATTTTYTGGGGSGSGWIDIRGVQPRLNEDTTYELPDGSKLEIDQLGNYQVKDTDAKVVYKACRVREFNPYINASDLLERFIEAAGAFGVTQENILKVPVEAFVNWLVREAAVKDGDSLEGLPAPGAGLLGAPA